MLERQDLDAVACLSARCFGGSAWSAEAFERELARRVSRVLVARREGELAGYGLGYVIERECEVLSVAVAPAARRLGVGRALLSRLVDGCEVAHLEVRRDNVAALALYLGFGFGRAGVRAGYYADGEDALLLRWTA